MRNPLYHWTHLELKTAFGINKILSPKTAREIYDECNAKLALPEYSARGMMRRYHVEVVCTTDDPVDSLEYHIKTRESGFEIKMLPTWRPDKAMAVEVPSEFRAYVEKLAEVSGITISTFDDMVAALKNVTNSLPSKVANSPTTVSKNSMPKTIPMPKSKPFSTKYMAAPNSRTKRF